MSLRYSLVNNKMKKEGGFGMLEVVISVGIVSFSFVGLMGVFAYNYRVAMLNRDRIVAAYLAQEAIEIVKQKRDTNWFDGNAATVWNTGIPSGTGVTYVLRQTDRNDLTRGWTIVASSGAESESLHKNNKGEYVQTTGLPSSFIDTHFKRTLNIEPADGGNAMKITVNVSINNSNNVRVISYLYDKWY